MKMLNYLLSVVILAIIVSCNEVTKNVESSETNSASKTELAGASSDMLMHPEYAKTVARMAYIWGYPMVNMMNRRAAIGSAPEPGLMGGVIPVSPTGQIAMLNDYVKPNQSFIACPNQDVV